MILTYVLIFHQLLYPDPRGRMLRALSMRRGSPPKHSRLVTCNIVEAASIDETLKIRLI